MVDAPPRNRPGAFVPSLVAALAIFGYMLVTTSVSVLLGQLAYIPELSAEYLAEFGRTALLYTAFAAACLLSFWLVAPIVARLSLWQVIARVLVAAGVSFVVMLPIQFAILSAVYADVEPVNGGGLYDMVELYYSEPNVILVAIGNMLQFTIGRLPIIALAALALWWWLRRKESSRGEA